MTYEAKTETGREAGKGETVGMKSVFLHIISVIRTGSNPGRSLLKLKTNSLLGETENMQAAESDCCFCHFTPFWQCRLQIYIRLSALHFCSSACRRGNYLHTEQSGRDFPHLTAETVKTQQCFCRKEPELELLKNRRNNRKRKITRKLWRKKERTKQLKQDQEEAALKILRHWYFWLQKCTFSPWFKPAKIE